MYPIIVIIAAAVVAFSGCVQPCPSERVWMLDPYVYEMGMIAPLVINPGDLNNSDYFYTDEEFAEFLGLSLDDFLRLVEKQKTDTMILPKDVIISPKGTI